MSTYTPIPLPQGIQAAHLHLLRNELDAAEALLHTLNTVYPGTPDIVQMLNQIDQKRQAKSNSRRLPRSAARGASATSFDYRALYLLFIPLFLAARAWWGFDLPGRRRGEIPGYEGHPLPLGAQVVIGAVVVFAIVVAIRESIARAARKNSKSVAGD